MIILSLWVNDTMAYLVGSLIGKTPLSENFSQKNMGGYHWWNRIRRTRHGRPRLFSKQWI